MGVSNTNRYQFISKPANFFLGDFHERYCIEEN